jgi:hypothetical protein
MLFKNTIKGITMYTIQVPPNEITVMEDMPTKKNFFWYNLRNILSKTLNKMSGLDAQDFIKDVYDPLREPMNTNAKEFVVEKDKNFNTLKDLVGKNPFGWATNEPADDIPAIMQAFSNAVKS